MSRKAQHQNLRFALGVVTVSRFAPDGKKYGLERSLPRSGELKGRIKGDGSHCFDYGGCRIDSRPLYFPLYFPSSEGKVRSRVATSPRLRFALSVPSFRAGISGQPQYALCRPVPPTRIMDETTSNHSMSSPYFSPSGANRNTVTTPTRSASKGKVTPALACASG